MILGQVMQTLTYQSHFQRQCQVGLVAVPVPGNHDMFVLWGWAVRVGLVVPLVDVRRHCAVVTIVVVTTATTCPN